MGEPADTTRTLVNYTPGNGNNTMTGKSSNVLTIVLATTIPVLAIVIMALAICCSPGRRRKASFLRRGVTPIADEEIETWKGDRGGEKDPIIETGRSHSHSHSHGLNNSVSSIHKPAGLIVYQDPSQNRIRLSEDKSPLSPISPFQKLSLDLPPAAVLARAPNSRPGLTDDMVQGDDAFIPQVKRQPSRLAKPQPSSGSGSPRHMRSQSHWVSSTRDPSWPSNHADNSPPSARRSADTFTRRPAMQQLGLPGHRRVYSSSSPPTPRLSSDEDVLFTGLSPRPVVRKSEIGRAIG